MIYNDVEESCFGTFFSRLKFQQDLPDPIAEKMSEYLWKEHIDIDLVAGGDAVASFRSNYIDGLVKKEIESGKIRTVFNAGCGFCTRYWRLGLDKTDVYWVDCDQSKILHIKEKALLSCKVDLSDNYVMAHADFTVESFPPSFDLYIAEGLFMWLPIDFMKNNIHSRTVFDVIGEDREGGFNEARGQKWQFSPQDPTWNQMCIESSKQVGDVRRGHRVVVAYPK